MDLVTVTKDNIDKEHICCAISNDRDCQVASKKEWLKQRFEDGLVFTKGNVRGKCFIEYIPAENAWYPITAEGYMYIDCLWVSGQFKGQGNSSLLLDSCIADSKAKGRKGLVTLSSAKKKPFVADKKFLLYKGFRVCDTAEPDYELMYLPFDESVEASKEACTSADTPKFRSQAKKPHIEQKGIVIYYAHQCPYTAKYVPILQAMANERHVPFQAIRFETATQAQEAPAPYTSFGLFADGDYLTNEILSEKKFALLLDKMA